MPINLIRHNGWYPIFPRKDGVTFTSCWRNLLAHVKGASLLLLNLLCACQWPSILPLSGNQFQIFLTYCKVEGMICHVFCHLVWSSSTIIHLFLYFATKFSWNWSNFPPSSNKCVYFDTFCHLVWSITVTFDHFQSQLSIYFITKKPQKTCT